MLLNQAPTDHTSHHDNHPTDHTSHQNDHPTDHTSHHDDHPTDHTSHLDNYPMDHTSHHDDHSTDHTSHLDDCPTDHTSHLDDQPTSALFAAAQNGHTDCVKLLLSAGVSADVSDDNGFTPLHFAAARGHHRCVCALVSGGADVDRSALGGQTPLYVACEAGRLECVAALLDAGADRAQTTTDSCTALHAAVTSGHVNTLRLLLCHPGLDPSPNPSPDHDHNQNLERAQPQERAQPPGPPRGALALPSKLLNQANSEGWTAAHIAAARGFKHCLEVLCSHSEQDMEGRDRWNRTVHDVATDDCKDLLENLDCYRVCVCVRSSCGGEPMCPVEVLGGEVGVSPLGGVSVHRGLTWSELGHALGHALTSHLQLLCSPPSLHTHLGRDDAHLGREDAHTHLSREDAHTRLGLSPASISSVLIGDTVWLPGQELTPSPWDLVRKPLGQCITIRLKGMSESCLDELALESLIPLHLLQNYIRLVEQYRNVMFHGLEGSCHEYLANQIARCIKHKQEVAGMGCDIIRVEVDEGLTKEQLLETFITCGFLVPVGSVCSDRCVVVLLEGLEKAGSLSELLGDLCEGLENRGTAYPLPLLHGQAGLHHFQECGFLIGLLAKPRLQGSELRLQQHFRWVTLRWDAEPLHGLLGRHLRRKLLNKSQGCGRDPGGLMERTLGWVSLVWQQLNACLARLGTHEALLGPQLFLSCPVSPGNTQPIVKWLARLWNMVVVPRVEDAIVSRVMVKRSPGQRLSPSKQHLSPGQQAVVKAALSILVNKAVLQGCPLPRHEIDRHLLEFRGGTFPMSAIGSCKGGGGRKGRDTGMWRRANTSPRKKGSPASNWSSTGSLREGSRSNTDVRFITNGDGQRAVDGEQVNLSLCSDEETDLIRELQTMCSSKSEPDISTITQSNDDFLVFPDSPSGPSTQSPHQTDQETTAPLRPQTVGTGSRHSNRSPAPTAQSTERGSIPRPKSQLPVPSSRGQQRASSSSNASTAQRTQTTTNRNTTRPHFGSKARQPLPSNSYHGNDNNQPQEDIWILHENINNNK